MLPKANRLKKKKDFEFVFKRGRGFKEDFLYLKFVKNNKENSRFGFIVGRKFSGKAVARNKLRRRLRNIINIKIEGIKKGLDIVLVVLPGFKINDFWELEEKIGNLFEKAKIIEK